MAQDPTPPRLYELRIAAIADGRLRHQVARWLAGRFPAHEVPAIVTALGGAGFTTRFMLADGGAPQLLRALYAAGAPPAGVILRPAGLAGPPLTPHEQVQADRAFAVFAGRGGRFWPTWNWSAFVFGPLWYLRKGLYAKGLVLLVLGVIPIWTLTTTVLVSLASLVYCGLAGNWDHYLWKVQRKQWW